MTAVLVGMCKLNVTLIRRTTETLTDFGRPGTSNSPTDATACRIEYLRGCALGFRNHTSDCTLSGVTPNGEEGYVYAS